MIALLLACSFEEAAVQTMASNPLLTVDRDIDTSPVQTEVAERLDAGSYVYLRTVEGAWVVGLDRPLQPGDPLRYRPIGVARGFHSGRLDRTFDAVAFAVIEGGR